MCWLFENGTFELSDGDIDPTLAASLRAGTPLLASLRSHGYNFELIDLFLHSGANPCQTGVIALHKKKNGDEDHDWKPSLGWDLESCDPLRVVTSFFARQIFGEDVEDHTRILKKLLESMKTRMEQIPQTALDDCMRGLCTTYLRSDWSRSYPDSGHSWRVPVDAIHLLLDLGGNPKVSGSNNLTLLHVVCSREGDDGAEVERLLRRLVKLGADVNARDNLWRTPLHYAAVFSPATILPLIELGGSRNSTDVSVRSPLQFACGGADSTSYGFRGDSVRLFLDSPYDGYVNWEKIIIPACSGVERNYNIRVKDDEQDTLLIARLIERASNLNILDLRSALRIACDAYSTAPLAAICGSPRAWENFRDQDDLGRTPLISVVQRRSRKKVRLLIDAIMTSYRNSGTYFREDRSGTSKQKHKRNRFSQVNQVDVPTAEDEYIELEPLPPKLETQRSKHYLHRPERRFLRISHEGIAQCLNMRDYFGWTALHYAAQSGNGGVVDVLVQEPFLDVGSVKGCCIPSPLELAYQSENAECVRHIRNAIDQRKARLDKIGDTMTSENFSARIPATAKRSMPVGHNYLSIVGRLEVRIVAAVILLSWIWFKQKSDLLLSDHSREQGT